MLRIAAALVLLALPLQAHNDRIAYAVAVEGIVVDGDLSDWPDDLPVYAIRHNTDAYGTTDLAGTDLDASHDFSPEFRVAYSPSDQRIYVAIRARDDVIYEDGDGCEIYLNAHGDGPQFQFLAALDEETPQLLTLGEFFGSMPFGHTDEFLESGSRYAARVQDGHVVYEWALAPLGDSLADRVLLEPGLRLGFDVTAQDQDGEEDTQAWVAWSPGAYKSDETRVGDLVFVSEVHELGSLHGSVRNVSSGEPVSGVEVRAWTAQDVTSDITTTGVNGTFELNVPAGSYSMAGTGTDTVQVRVKGQQPVRDLELATSSSGGVMSVRAGPIVDPDDGVWLSTGARYRVGDGSDWAQTDYDDMDWSSVVSDEELIEPGEGDRVVWFRFHLSVDSALEHTPVAVRFGKSDSVRLYLNGEQIWDTADTVPGWDRDLPRIAVLGAGTRHLLAVRYAWSASLPVVQAWEYGLFLDEANVTLGELIRFKLIETTLIYLFIGVPSTLTLFHLLLFAFYPRGRENLYYGLFTFCVAAIALSLAQEDALNALFGDQGATFAICGLFSVGAVMAAMRFVYSMFHEDTPRTFLVFAAGGINVAGSIVGIVLYSVLGWGPAMDGAVAVGVGVAGLCGAVLFFLHTRRPLPRTFWIAWVLFLPVYPLSGGATMWIGLLSLAVFIEVARVLVRAVRQGRVGARIVGPGFLLFAGALFYIPVAGFSGAPEPPFAVLSVGAFALLGAMSVHLARQVASTNRSLATRLVQVEELSERNLAQERALRERMERELEEGRRLQLSMLPAKKPEATNLDIAWRMDTATEVGGDYYDYSLTDDGTLTLCVGDATGHGMDAGVVVTGTKSLFRTFADAPSITESLTVMSKSLKGMNLHRMGMAMTLLRFSGRECDVSSAGMPPAWVYRAATGDVEEMNVSGYPLGMSYRATYQAESFSLSPEDVVLLMTDGLAERLNPRDEYFDYDRTKALFAQAATGSSEAIVDELLKGGEEWAEGRPQDDDITLVVLKYTPDSTRA